VEFSNEASNQVISILSNQRQAVSGPLTRSWKYLVTYFDEQKTLVQGIVHIQVLMTLHAVTAVMFNTATDS
jgi:hypothetical protein